MRAARRVPRCQPRILPGTLVATLRVCGCLPTRRDEALVAIQDAMRKQQEQELAIETEIMGFKKSILKEQIRNEQLMGVVRKVRWPGRDCGAAGVRTAEGKGSLTGPCSIIRKGNTGCLGAAQSSALCTDVSGLCCCLEFLVRTRRQAAAQSLQQCWGASHTNTTAGAKLVSSLNQRLPCLGCQPAEQQRLTALG